MAGYDTLDADWVGYILIWFNNFFGAFYNVIMVKMNQDKKISIFAISFFFGAVGAPLCFALSMYQNDLGSLAEVFVFRGKSSMELAILILVSGIFGVIIQFFHTVATTTIGPFTTNICGALKDVILTFVGFFFFKDVVATHDVILGLIISFTGSAYYIYQNYLELYELPEGDVKSDSGGGDSFEVKAGNAKS